MRRAVTFFLLVFFLSAVHNNSMQMLSIENGKVYTEGYSLSHIFKNSTFGTQKFLSTIPHSFDSNFFCQYFHISLKKTYLPEKQAVDIDTPVNKTFMFNPLNLLSFLSSPSSAFLAKYYKPLTKFPRLLKTTVLLIYFQQYGPYLAIRPATYEILQNGINFK
jgi:hypothetical protein